MRARRSRVRQVAKWVGLVAVLVVATVYILGGWLGVTVASEGSWHVMVGRGAILFMWNSKSFAPEPPAGWLMAWHTADSFVWKPSVHKLFGFGTLSVLTVPFWIPLLMLAVPTAFLWHRDRRPPRGHCQQCGYNLHGLTEPRCPECGTGFEPRGDAR